MLHDGEPSRWRTPLRWRRLSPRERLAIDEERFVRLRSRHDVLRHRRPGEYQVPGIKISVAVGVVVGAALRLVGIGALWQDIALAALGTLAVTVALFLVGNVVYHVLARLLGWGHRPPPPPLDPAGVPARR